MHCCFGIIQKGLPRNSRITGIELTLDTEDTEREEKPLNKQVLTNFINEPARQIPILDETDVLVVGGGPAGIGASLAAAREGAKTMLLERYGFLGGCSTISSVTTICGLYRVESGKPIPIIKGIAWEVVEKLRQLGSVTGPKPVGRSFLVIFDDNRLKEVADDMVVESNVKVLYHALAADVVIQGNEVKGVIIESKRGREAIISKIVIDATGDGDIAARAGVPYQRGDNGVLQYPTLMFKMNRVDIENEKQIPRDVFERTMREVYEKGEFKLPRLSGSPRLTPQSGEVICNLTRISRESDHPYIDGTDPRDLTYAEIEGRKQVRLYEAFLKKHIHGFEEAYVSQSGPQIGIRETRLIQGEFVLGKDDILSGKKADDGILRSSWPLEIHGSDKKTTWVWLSEGNYYEIPYRCLVPLQVENLLIAGRCISTTHEAQASTRVSACCYGTGQAAGTAAALAVEKGIVPRKVNVVELQRRLKSRGCLI